MKSSFKVVLLSLAAISMMAFACATLAASYEGLGVKFDYPGKYKVKEKNRKTLKEIKLWKGGNTIKISIKKRFTDEIRESIAQGMYNSAKRSGEVSDVELDKHAKLPLKVNGNEQGIDVDALKNGYTKTMTHGNNKIVTHQAMYIFSHGDSGYIVKFTGKKNDASDLGKVLSNFQFLK